MTAFFDLNAFGFSSQFTAKMEHEIRIFIFLIQNGAM